MEPSLVRKFSTNLRQALSKAAELTLELGGKTIEPEHLLLALTLQKGGIAFDVLNRSHIESSAIRTYLQKHVKTSVLAVNIGDLEFSMDAKRALEKAVVAAAHYEHAYVGTEHLLWGLLEVESQSFTALLHTTALQPAETKHQLQVVLRSTSKFPDLANFFQSDTREKESEVDERKQSKEKTPALDAFARDLTSDQQLATIDPVIGRTAEIDRLIHILCRRTKNNPVLVGEPGVGKTAIVEGLARKIAEGTVPDVLHEKKLLALDLGLVVAGTMYRGEFESRLKQVLDEIQADPNIILFIDELHTIIGAGSASGSMDAANLLKPALAKGLIRCIGATTHEEYRKHIESDPALERRFQPIQVSEPTAEETVEILKGLKSNYEQFHRVSISEEAIHAAVSLSSRYLQERFQPDKSIDLIDEAASKLKVGRPVSAAAKEIRTIEQRIAGLESQKHEAVEAEKFERALALKEESEMLTTKLQRLKDRQREPGRGVSGTVNKHDVAEIVARMTNIPLTDLLRAERDRLVHLEKRLQERIVGQDEALAALADAIRRARVGFAQPNRPIGSFMFLGPSGVGKTATAKAIAELVFEDPNALVRIDMSEYGESFTVSKLIGAPAGYVGYKESGKLTEAVRRKPYSVVLFDEIEKAHPDIFNVLLQVLDDGYLTDAAGKRVNFQNTIIILTSNVGLPSLNQAAALGFAPAGKADVEQAEHRYQTIRDSVIDEVHRQFRPEFLNRLDRIIVYKPLTQAAMESIVDLELAALHTRLQEQAIVVKLTRSARHWLAHQSFNPDQGARALKRLLEEQVSTPLAGLVLNGKLKRGATVRVTVKRGALALEPLK